ncbi:MAG: cell division protein FtsA [Omnitrophica bacterium RIFCSPLOWO2_12_FULL_44_17]|uniref:Cell division protein FtsA n=1 Tax=Candidatus Danuiimicrobium aquiferis TaxID=1801832 RepID=A0A1G1L0S7_9BACT|nr:MAG: cell division protein FtsA [Omnitrophica bacterium RIFCSPHIGHO2_02_FULL_45_28]OGW89877.1 MAG: cell division protein FtsA [Omnitrophica bacterium RIFCSPHIGHO2_12_FULL_44_12]OGW98728.1 MAG: cell division protein FtsA [Omnitrophica bacterium RIFCSPLOWO2_12_FULL_44_17]OGX03119.1 MAG: cell division protein FtsA [Omnitrophica bacterium RIFCSPLOWO2_02_FULL_44_11]
MTKKEKNIYLSYIGTTKTAFLKARYSLDGQPEVLSLSARLSDGFERGVVKDLYQASETVTQEINDIVGAEHESILPCKLVVSNAYVRNYTFHSSIYFQDRPHALTLKDVRDAIAQTRSVATIPLDQVIIQAVPQAFLVNDLDGIQNPIGLEASRLGVTLRLLTLDGYVYSNLLRVFEMCDVEVTDIIPGVLASSHAVLTSEEKQNGVILVDIGGNVTQFACYQSNVLVQTCSIPIGADHMTEVLAKELNISKLDAQKVKEAYGSAVSRREFREELIPIRDTKGEKEFTIKRTEFEAHLDTGMKHFFSEMNGQIKTLQKQFAPLNQVVFTGGGSKLEGLLDVVKEAVSPIARIGIAKGIIGPEALITNPAFSSALGGISYSSRVSDYGRLVASPSNWFSRAVETTRNWVFEYF